MRTHVLDVYERAWAGTQFSPTPEQLSDFGAILDRHIAQRHFRLIGAYDDAGDLTGFAYGYASAPGGWWRDVVTRSLHEDIVERWFSDAFEFVELAVHPRMQRRGVGTRLHDALLEGVDRGTAVLSTQSENVIARRLYERRGWVVLDPAFMFPNRSYPYTIMGLDLEPARRAPGAGRPLRRTRSS